MFRYFAIILAAVLTAFAANAQPKVVVTFPILHSLTTMVTDGITEPTLLFTGSPDLHHLHLKPSQRKAVAEADIVVYYADTLEGFIPKLRQTDEPKLYLPLGARETTDGFAWLNPARAERMLTLMAVNFARQDPAHEAAYLANAKAAARKIHAAGESWRKILPPSAARPASAELGMVYTIASDHPAFAPFAEYFLQDPVLVMEKPSGGISAKGLAGMMKQPLKCIFVTHGHSHTAEKLAEETGAKLITDFNPLGGKRDSAPDLYFQLMTDLVNTYNQCLTHP